MSASAFDRTAALIDAKTTELERCFHAGDFDRMFVLITELTQLTKQLEIDDTGDMDG